MYKRQYQNRTFESQIKNEDNSNRNETDRFEVLEFWGCVDKKVLEENFFVEKMLGTDPIKPLSEEVMNEYRKPFVNAGEDRRPTLDWPRQIPIDNEPIEVYDEVKANLNFMMETDLPKFLKKLISFTVESFSTIF